MSKPRRTPVRGASRKQRRVPILVIGAAIVVALVIAIVGTRDSGNDAGGVAQTQPVTVSGVALPPLTDAAVDVAAGRPAPELTGAGFDGAAIRIANDGRPKVVIFVAHWCPHCQAEVPVIAAWLAENGLPGDVDLYGVSTSVSKDRPNYPPSAWLEKQRWLIPTIADSEDSRAAAAFGLNAFPFFAVINARGDIVTRVTGELPTAQFAQLIALAKA
jgi:thiol-disulfide isomerase/thioredoxin